MKKNALIALTMTAFLALNAQVQGEPIATTPVSTVSGPTEVTQVMTLENQPALPAIASKHALLVYAKEQVRTVSSSIGTSLPMDNSYGSASIAGESSGAKIVKAIAEVSMSFDAPNPEDDYYLWSAAFNQDNDILFSGQNRFQLVGPDPSGKYSVPENYGDVTLEMSDEIPLNIPGATSALVSETGPDGKTKNQYSQRVRDGKVYYSQRLAGGNRILSVLVGQGAYGENPDYTWFYWSTKNDGQPIKPANFPVTVNASIKGLKMMTDSNVFVQVQTSNSNGENQIAELTVTKPYTAKVSFWTAEGKWFNMAWVKKTGETKWVLYTSSLDRTIGAIDFVLPVQPGVYNIIPVWNAGDLIEPADPYRPPYNWSSYYDRG